MESLFGLLGTVCGPLLSGAFFTVGLVLQHLFIMSSTLLPFQFIFLDGFLSNLDDKLEDSVGDAEVKEDSRQTVNFFKSQPFIHRLYQCFLPFCWGIIHSFIEPIFQPMISEYFHMFSSFFLAGMAYLVMYPPEQFVGPPR